MADNVITIELEALIGEFQAAFKSAGTTVKEFTGVVDTLNASFLAIGAIFAGGSILSGIKALDTEVSKIKTSFAEAANSMKNMGGKLDTGRLKDFISSLSQGAAAGVASFDELSGSVQILGQHVENTAQLQRAMSDAVELAARTGSSYNEAVKQVSKGLSGYVTILTRAGIITADEKKNLHTVADAMNLLEKKTANATSAVDDNTKAWGRLQSAWQQASNTLGNDLAPAVGDLVQQMQDSIPNIEAFIVVFVQIAEHISTGVRVLADFAGEIEHWGSVLVNFGQVIQDIASRNFAGAAKHLIAMREEAKATADAYNDINKAGLKIYSTFESLFQGDFHIGKVRPPGNGGEPPDFPGDLTGKQPGGTHPAPDTSWLTELLANQLPKSAFDAMGRIFTDATKTLANSFVPLDVVLDSTKKGMNQFNEGLVKLNQAVIENATAFYRHAREAEDGLKRLALSAPGVREDKDTHKLYFSLADVLNDVLQKSKGVADLFRMLGNIVGLVANVLDAVLVPIIHVLDSVLTALANIVIDVWNVFATLLNALGLHVDYLKHINSLLGDLGASVRPLIDIVHDLPSLKEYQAGKWGPLQPDQFGGSQGGGLLSKVDQQSTFFQKIIGVLGAIFAIDWLTHSKFFADVSGFFSRLFANAQGWWKDLSTKSQQAIKGAGQIALGIALVNTHATGIIGTLERIFGVLQIVQGILAIIQALTAVKGIMGPLPCPAVDQIMETKEHGFILAGDLKPGMHLRAGACEHGCEWHELYSVKILPTTIVQSTNEVEPIRVNWEHAFKDKDGVWVLARELNPGDELLRYGGGLIKITATDVLGAGDYASLDCQHHDYVIGHTIGHNDSGVAAAALSNAVARAFSVMVNAVADHVAGIANVPGNIAGIARSAGIGGGGGSTSSTDDHSMQQIVHIGQVNEAANLEQVISALSKESVFFGKGRAYQQGYQGI